METIYQQLRHYCQKIKTDSRKIEPNDVFWTLKGDNFNGNKFVRQAFERGAAYAVVDEESACISSKCILVDDGLKALQDFARLHREHANIPVLALTGSNGKTTTKELIAAVLSANYDISSTPGNLNNHIGVPLSLLQINQSTEIAIIEMGANHPGEIKELCEIAKPDYGLITNVGKAHIKGFGSFEGVKQSKKELYDYIHQNGGKLFLWNDSDDLKEMISQKAVLTYGLATDSDIIGTIRRVFPHLQIEWKRGLSGLQQETESKLFGAFNYPNVLAAVSIGVFFGIASGDINRAIDRYTPDNNRSQVVNTKKNSVLLDAYNANPTSMNLAVDSVIAYQAANKWLILGDMLELGSTSATEHFNLAEKVAGVENLNVILIGKNFERGARNFEIRWFPDVSTAIANINNLKISNGFVFLKASRSMKLEDLVSVL